jgi:hypothetical protein
MIYPFDFGIRATHRVSSFQQSLGEAFLTREKGNAHLLTHRAVLFNSTPCFGLFIRLRQDTLQLAVGSFIRFGRRCHLPYQQGKGIVFDKQVFIAYG